MKKMLSTLLSLILIFFLSSLLAQDKTKLALDIADAQEKNRVNLMNYSWQRSTKAYVNDVEKIKTLMKVWFNSEGAMETTILGSESSVEEKKGRKGKQQQTEGDKKLALLGQVLDLSIKYVFLSKGSWIDLVDGPNVKIENNVLKIDTKDLLTLGDEVHYIIDDSTKLFKSINFTSRIGEKTFTSSIDFKTMKDGTNHPARTVITIPSESMRIVAENIDYIKQQ